MVLIIEKKAGERINLVCIPEAEFRRFYEEHVKRISPTQLTVLVEFNPQARDWDNVPSYEQTLRALILSIEGQRIKTESGITRDYLLSMHRTLKDLLKVRTYHPRAGFLRIADKGYFQLTIERRKEHFQFLTSTELAEINQRVKEARIRSKQEPLVYAISHIGLSY